MCNWHARAIKLFSAVYPILGSTFFQVNYITHSFKLYAVNRHLWVHINYNSWACY